jgi:hypothetical protein
VRWSVRAGVCDAATDRLAPLVAAYFLHETPETEARVNGFRVRRLATRVLSAERD